MTFTTQDILVCVLLAFTVGLYVGALVQRRRDVKAFKPARKLIRNFLKMKEENQNEKEDEICNV